jgi:hypothetical protein
LRRSFSGLRRRPDGAYSLTCRTSALNTTSITPARTPSNGGTMRAALQSEAAPNTRGSLPSRQASWGHRDRTGRESAPYTRRAGQRVSGCKTRTTWGAKGGRSRAAALPKQQCKEIAKCSAASEGGSSAPLDGSTLNLCKAATVSPLRSPTATGSTSLLDGVYDIHTPPTWGLPLAGESLRVGRPARPFNLLTWNYPVFHPERADVPSPHLCLEACTKRPIL